MTLWPNAWDVEEVFSHVTLNPLVPGQAIAKMELRKVWNAMSSCVSEALYRRRGAIIPNFGMFTLFTREVKDHGAWTSHMVHELLFCLDPAFETTFHMSTNEASQASNQSRLASAVPTLKIPLSILQEKTGLPRALVSDCLRDTLRSIGEGVFRGVSFVLDLPTVGRLYLKSNKCRVIFAEALVNSLVQGDVARAHTPQRRMFPTHPNHTDGWPSSARPSPAGAATSPEFFASPIPTDAANESPAFGATMPQPPSGPRSSSTTRHRPHTAPRPRSASQHADPEAASGPGPCMPPFRLGSPRSGQLFQEVKSKRPNPPPLLAAKAVRGRTLVRKAHRSPSATNASTQTPVGDGPARRDDAVRQPLGYQCVGVAQTDDDEDVRALLGLPLPAAAPPPVVAGAPLLRVAAPPSPPSPPSHPTPELVPPPDFTPVIETTAPPLPQTTLHNPFVRDEVAERQRKRDLALKIEQDNLARSAAKRSAMEEARQKERAAALARLSAQPHPSSPAAPAGASDRIAAEDTVARRAWLEAVPSALAPRQQPAA
jgi:hypothetical protein